MASPNASCWHTGGWRIEYRSRSQSLSARHTATGFRLKCTISYESTAPDDGFWQVGLDPTCGGRLTLTDPNGNCQAYVTLCGSSDRLDLSVAQRPPMAGSGRLSLCGRATLGRETFACRTQRPDAEVRVVQMASGPADSRLNDALFDVKKDTAIRFQGDRVGIQTTPGAGTGRVSFGVALEADVGAAGAGSISVVAQGGFYRERYVPWYRPIDRDRAPHAPTGWMSWNTYFDTAGERENLAEARFAARKFSPFGLQIWSIESWQDNSSKLPVSEFHHLTLRPHEPQFPHGMKWLADRIRSLGFRPGIWTAPFGTGDTAFYEAHRAWFLHDADNRPMRNWNGRYVLDPSLPAVRSHTRETHRVMAEEWGYEFFKVDGLSATGPGYSSHFYERPEVRQAFRRASQHPMKSLIDALRMGIGGDSVMLACMGHYTGPEAASADAARIGTDVVSRGKPPGWGNYMSQVTSTLAQLFAHNIVWYNDPDTLLVGRFAARDVARLAATVVALPGQVTFLGDRLAQLPPDRVRLLQQCLPACDVRPLDLYPVYNQAPVWDLKIRRPFAAWDVVSLYNFREDRSQSVGVEPWELGLDPGAHYLAFDFWRGKMLGRISKRLRVRLRPSSNALIALHPDLGRPQFVSTDRHLTQGGTSLKDLAWDADACVLSGVSRVVGGSTSTVFLYVPKGYSPARGSARGARVQISRIRADRTVKVMLTSTRSRSAVWSVRFRRTSRR